MQNPCAVPHGVRTFGLESEMTRRFSLLCVLALVGLAHADIVWYTDDSCNDKDVRLVFDGNTCYNYKIDASTTDYHYVRGISAQGGPARVTVWSSEDCHNSDGHYIHIDQQHAYRCSPLMISDDFGKLLQATVAVETSEGHSYVFSHGMMSKTRGM